MTDLSFLQRQPTRTRFATGQSVQRTRRAVKTALDGCERVAAWNDDGFDLYAESDQGRFDDGYRSNVDVYEHDDGRTHVLVDSSSLRFVGSLDGSLTQKNVDVRPDQFHDAVVGAIVATLTDTPRERVSSRAWAPPASTDPLDSIRDEFDEDELDPETARGQRSTSPSDDHDASPSTNPDTTTSDHSRNETDDTDGTDGTNDTQTSEDDRSDRDSDIDTYDKAFAERSQIETESASRLAYLFPRRECRPSGRA